MTSTVAEIDDALLKAGVYALSKKARLVVAEALWQVKIAASDIHILEQWVIQSEPKEGLARRYLAGLLADAPGAAQAIADLAKHKSMATHKHDRNAMNWSPQPSEDEDEQKWNHDRQCRIAACRVNSDRIDRAVVAKELGVSTEQLAAMIAHGESQQRSIVLDS